MKNISLCFHVLIVLSLQSVTSLRAEDRATTPPRGWNSYDSYGWIISEEDFLANAEHVAQRLKDSGYEYVVVDYLWYRKQQHGVTMRSRGHDNIDFWGRVVPDPDRWPSCRDGKGFTDIAQKVHDMGLKFGIHVMRGISTQAFDFNSPIHDSIKGGSYEEGGREWTAKDIGLPNNACGWMSEGFMSVDTSLGAGRAYLRSLYTQYRDWGVDFIKHDCVFGDDFSLDEITYVSQVIAELDRPIIYSLSPGKRVNQEKARQVSELVNMYRITGDDWDRWSDVEAHFDVTRDLNSAGLTGAAGLKGKSWPDLDMLPLGWLTDPEAGEGPHRQSALTPDEQKTQMTLWAIAKSPLMFGGDMKKLDEATYAIISNPTILEINSFSSNNKEFATNFVRLNWGKGRQQQFKNDLKLIGGVGNELALELTTCGDSNVKGWTTEANDGHPDKICWKDGDFCLHLWNSSMSVDNGTRNDNDTFLGKFLLSTSRSHDFCLDASSGKKLTAGETKRISSSNCKGNESQMWEYHSNRTLVSSYSGLCAVVKTQDPFQRKMGNNGVRAWIATGRNGDVYVAFFNTNNEKMWIQAKISDLTSLLPAEFYLDTCFVVEEWSSSYWEETEEVSAEIKPHGCLLFSLKLPIPAHRPRNV